MAAGTEHQLADGRMVVLHPAGPADVPAITRLYLALTGHVLLPAFLQQAAGG